VNPILQKFLLLTFQPWCVAMFVMIAASAWRKKTKQKYDDFITALGFVGFSIVATFLQDLILKLIPHTIDASLLRIDRQLGFDALRLFGFMLYHHSLWAALQIPYLWLPVVMAIAWVSEQSYELRRAVLLGGVFCWFFYAAFPAAGPSYLFTGVADYSPRNCMPSMHFSWALMLAVYSRTWLRRFLWMYAAVIALATLALGEHYIIDLIAAVPYTWAISYTSDRVFRSSLSRPCGAEIAPAN
jgi:hypothetical protein